MKFDLKNKTAIVTGGARGIGKAICLALAQQGAKVHVLDLDGAAAEETATSIRAQGHSAQGHHCDVTQQAQVTGLVQRIHEAGGIHILVNNAGIAHVGNVEKTSEEDLDRLYGVNIKGVYNGLYAAVPLMKAKGGVIINMASIASSIGLNDRFAYSMTKGAVATMTLSVAKDYVHHGIRCNSISPARVHTPFVDGFIKDNYPGKEAEMFQKLSQTQPIGRMGRPEEIADLAVYLCSDEASFITGTDFPIDGGFIKLNGN
ncbi:SDR family NAD(P)-dependent oxidoreductase [Maribacter sp. 2307ULW6-5]|uniref:SDR family NAD(P)-dependent oxidoreductase n=1 Tax=Maribacter sp. 2307ULW6-5 TaxID=3386275 RepID=UPI0039BD1C21